jgi:hypothetical protein
MPRQLSQTQREIVLTLLETNAKQTDIAEHAKCSVRQVKRIAKNKQAFGTAVAPKLKKQGRPFKLTTNITEVLLHYIFLLCLELTNI